MVDDDKERVFNIKGKILPPIVIGIFLWGLYDILHRVYLIGYG